MSAIKRYLEDRIDLIRDHIQYEIDRYNREQFVESGLQEGVPLDEDAATLLLERIRAHSETELDDRCIDYVIENMTIVYDSNSKIQIYVKEEVEDVQG